MISVIRGFSKTMDQNSLEEKGLHSYISYSWMLIDSQIIMEDQMNTSKHPKQQNYMQVLVTEIVRA